MRVWGPGFSANLQLPVQHDPLGGQFKILIVCEAEFAVDRQTAQRRRTDVEDNILALVNGDIVACGWHLLSGQVAGSDQRACLTAGDPAFWA